MSIGTDYFDCRSYLQLMWPKNPDDTTLKNDNFWMLEQYTKIADILGKIGKKYKNLDIGTGPIWSPSLCFVPILDALQVSDYSPTNREILSTGPIDYWHSYAQIISNYREIKSNYITDLNNIDKFRKTNPPLDIDIKNNPIASTDLTKYDLVTMHYVADSITSDSVEYYQLMTNIFDSINPQATLVLSVLCGGIEWNDGTDRKFPSVTLSPVEIIKFLKDKGYTNILFKNSETTKTKNYEGSLLIISCQK